MFKNMWLQLTATKVIFNKFNGLQETYS